MKEIFNNKKLVILSFILSFVYIGIGTFDNLTGLNFESKLFDNLCNGESSGNVVCELSIMLLYSQSYLYGALLCNFLGASDFSFVICQMIVLIFFTVILWLILEVLKMIYVNIRNKLKK